MTTDDNAAPTPEEAKTLEEMRELDDGSVAAVMAIMFSSALDLISANRDDGQKHTIVISNGTHTYRSDVVLESMKERLGMELEQTELDDAESGSLESVRPMGSA